MKPYKYNEIVIFTMLVMMSVLLAGCLVADSEVSYRGRKRPVGNHTLRQIECGLTTRAWLVAALGEPTETSMADNGTEILKYRCIETRDNEFVLFPIVFVDDKKETDHSVSFEIRDGIVQRFWKEG